MDSLWAYLQVILSELLVVPKLNVGSYRTDDNHSSRSHNIKRIDP